nr:gamma-aminobutyric acid type B receptor subunit 2-like [Lytechinus pictus]
MTWGPMFSSVATVVNEIAPNTNIIVQVVIASSSTLNDRTHYPLTVRISVDEDLLNPVRVAFIKKMGWSRVAIIFEDTDYFRENTKQLTLLLRQIDVTVLATEAVNDINSAETQLESLKRHDARIIFAGFLPDQAAIIFCKIYQQGLYGSKYVWIIPGWFPDGWWKNHDPEAVPCTSEEMEMMLEYHIGFDGDQFVSDVESIDFNGVKPQPRHLEYLRALHEMDDNSRDIYAYDNLITMALILNSSIVDVEQLPYNNDGDTVRPRRLDDFTYMDKEMAEVFFKHAGKISFIGLTDKVEIRSMGIRSSLVYVEQSVGSNVLKIMAYSDKDGMFHSVGNRSVTWKDGRQPVDGITYQPIYERVSSSVQIVIYSLSGVGIVLSLIFLALNIHYREYRTIKISSPILNNLIFIGCLLLYIATLIPGLDTSSYSERSIIVLCHVQTSLISIGISLSLGALFSKTYRIHAIFKKAVERLKKINLPDSKLILGVCALVLADIIIIMFRVVVDDVHVTSHSLNAQLDTADPNKELYIVPTVRTCESSNQIIFQLIMYGIKGILLMFGIFLAWETRDVTVSYLNDSKYIAFSVYTIAVTMAISVPMINVFMYQIDVFFIIFGCAILFANTTVLCLVFVPKIWPLCCCQLGHGDTDSSQITLSSSHMMQRSSRGMTKTEKSSKASSSHHAFHFRSADEGINQLTDELEKKRQELTALQIEYERLSSVVSQDCEG